MKNGWQFCVWFCLFALMTGCTMPASSPPIQLDVPPEKNRAGLRILTNDGGRVSWSRKLNKIAFDRLGNDGYFDLWVMNPDGTGQQNLTANHPVLPNKHIGQPAWHPSGQLIVIQAQKAHVPRYADNKCTPGAGVLNDLWIITANGKRTWNIYAVRDDVSKDSAGVLHPHFSHDGRRLFWSERVRDNGRAFGEWVLKIADFSFDQFRGPQLGKITTYNPGGGSSFFASHSFSPDDQYVLFTGTQDGPLEIYEMKVATGNSRRLTHHSQLTWDEHAHYSPDGQQIVWMSSKDLRFTVRPFTLQTDLWRMNRNGTQIRRLTWFNTPNHPHFLGQKFAVAADSDWSPDGTQIAGLVVTNRPDTRKRGSGIIVLIDLPGE